MAQERVLIVDDEKVLCQSLKMDFKEDGYIVKISNSGEAAIEYLKKNSVDLVLLDMIMDPGIDGHDTFKKLKKINPGIKAILSSGYSETKKVKDTLKMGVLHYIQKPYTLEKLGTIVKKSLH